MIHPVEIGALWHQPENVLFYGDGGFEMKLRRIIPLALAAYAGWKKLSPQQRAAMKNKVTGSGADQLAQ